MKTAIERGMAAGELAERLERQELMRLKLGARPAATPFESPSFQKHTQRHQHRIR
jgi:hypothetical protein